MRERARQVIDEHRKRRAEIRARLKEFREFIDGAEHAALFAELAFCIMTANANALLCDEAHKELCAKGLFMTGGAAEIRPHLKGRARFHNKKAEYIVAARAALQRDGRIDLRSRLDGRDVIATRDWLVGHIKGLGYKEASHFLRNIGLGRDIAILDRHILRNLKLCGAIRSVPGSVGSRKAYLNIEEKMRRFAGSIAIPMDELDLVFWAMQTGFVYK